MFDMAVAPVQQPVPAAPVALTGAEIVGLAEGLVTATRSGGAGLADGEKVAVLAALEQLKAAAAAAQAHLAVALEASQVAGQEVAGVPASRRGRGIAAQVALARRESPVRGAQHLGLARALTAEMPCTLRALEQGLLSEWRATLVVRESACLAAEDRRRLDAELAADSGRCEGWGDARLVAQARQIAYRLDPHAVVARTRRAETERHVSIRPAPETMARVSALLPVAQGVALYASLKAAADAARAAGDPRGKGQVMADTLLTRVTGLAPTDPVPVTVGLVMTERTLLAGDAEPAFLPGYGTVPAGWARDLVAAATRRTPGPGTGPGSGGGPGAGAGGDGKVRAWLRRLFTAPSTGQLVAMDARSRCFPGNLATFLDLRDQTCRTPWCDAPIVHHDHAWTYAGGGPTTIDNGQGLCQACNHAKQAPGWRARAVPGETRHTIETTTPTGHRYRSTAPPPPGTPPGPHLLNGWTEENAPPGVDLAPTG
ncbi:MAG TPA: DUF222 domain-containing protein [Marmoricola sp.]|nr:DUF222 domain-containing protein [Marmoricola sp.]